MGAAFSFGFYSTALTVFTSFLTSCLISCFTSTFAGFFFEDSFSGLATAAFYGSGTGTAATFLLGIETRAVKPGKSYSISNSLNLSLLSFSFWRRPSTRAFLYSGVFSNELTLLRNISYFGTNFQSRFPCLNVSGCTFSIVWTSSCLPNIMYLFIAFAATSATFFSSNWMKAYPFGLAVSLERATRSF